MGMEVCESSDQTLLLMQVPRCPPCQAAENKHSHAERKSCLCVHPEAGLPVSLLFASHPLHFEQQIVHLGIFPARADKQRVLATTRLSSVLHPRTGRGTCHTTTVGL